jgi:hypothetical protein
VPPKGLWKDPENHKKFFDWLSLHLEITQPGRYHGVSHPLTYATEQWADVTPKVIEDHGGRKFHGKFLC